MMLLAQTLFKTTSRNERNENTYMYYSFQISGYHNHTSGFSGKGMDMCEDFYYPS